MESDKEHIDVTETCFLSSELSWSIGRNNYIKTFVLGIVPSVPQNGNMKEEI